MRSSARPTPIGRTGPVVHDPEPDQRLAGRDPVTPSSTAKPTRQHERRRHDHRDPGQARSSEKQGRRREAGGREQRPGDQPVDGERVEAAVELGGREGRRLGAGGAGRSSVGSRGVRVRSTWIVTPSPRSMMAPGISCTAIPGCRSSGGRPGCTSTVPLVEPRSVTTAMPWSAPEPGRISRWVDGDLLVGARHRDQSRLLVRGEPTRLGCASDQDHPVDVDHLAAGEDQPGDRAG